jgi:hypothetical protein
VQRALKSCSAAAAALVEFDTLTVTGLAVAVFPEVSVATAEIAWDPLATVEEFQDI